MKTLFSCHLCPLDTFREADLVRFPNSSEEAHLRGGECLRCPPNSVAGYMNTTIASCLCMRGYYYARSSNTSTTSVHNTSRAETCVICPANTYKDTTSKDEDCTLCADGLESRAGSVDETECLITNWQCALFCIHVRHEHGKRTKRPSIFPATLYHPTPLLDGGNK